MNKKEIVLITAANSPLGQEMVKYFLEHSEYIVVATTRQKNNFSGIQNSKNFYQIAGVDATVEKDLQKLATFLQKIKGDKIHVINCTGYYGGQEPFEQTSLEEAIKLLFSNYVTVLGIAKYILPIMKERRGGNFIAFSCTSVKYKYPQMGPYSAAKAALESLIGSISNEYSEYNIKSNCFVLSTLLTEHEKKVKPFGDHKNWVKLIDVCKVVNDFIGTNYNLVNGNTINLFQYSPTFFKKSYFERIKKRVND